MADLDANILAGIPMGLGTWSWGDRMFWGFGNGYSEADIAEAFRVSVESGVMLVDTAEVYGQGRSEQYVGKLLKTIDRKPIVASKFMPFPWRLSRKSLLRALQASLKRLQIPQIDLYQVHFPLPPVNLETWMEAMSEAVQREWIRAVGISNFDRNQMQRAVDALAKQGLTLASNQVEYHLLDRRVERSGLLAQCKELGVTLIAYSPLASGILTGKYSEQNPPRGVRAGRYTRRVMAQIQPLIDLLNKIGSDHAGKTPAQVSLNWVMAKGALPIPGAKNMLQAQTNAGALGWSLTGDEVAALDEMSERVTRGL